MGGYIIYYKQGGTSYRTKLYTTLEEAELKVKTLELLQNDVGITDIVLTKVCFDISEF